LKHVGANSVTSVTAYVILYSYIQVHKLVQIKSIVSKVCIIKGRKGRIFCKCSSLLLLEHFLL